MAEAYRLSQRKKNLPQHKLLLCTGYKSYYFSQILKVMSERSLGYKKINLGVLCVFLGLIINFLQQDAFFPNMILTET